MEDMVHEFPAWTLSKSDVEQHTGRSLSDVHFMQVVNELDGRIENFSESLYEDIVDRIVRDDFFSDEAE